MHQGTALDLLLDWIHTRQAIEELAEGEARCY
jgi:hypothetical protein